MDYTMLAKALSCRRPLGLVITLVTTGIVVGGCGCSFSAKDD